MATSEETTEFEDGDDDVSIPNGLPSERKPWFAGFVRWYKTPSIIL